MAGQQKLQGIGLDVVADASQIKRTFNEAIGGLQGKKIEMILTADWDKSTQTRIDALRKTKVQLDVVLAPTRTSIAAMRRTVRDALEQQPIQTPLKIKPVTQAEGKRIRDAIVAAIGTPTIPVILDPRWGGPSGPPAQGFRPGGGGGGGGAPTGGTQARGPVGGATAPQGGGAAPTAPGTQFSTQIRTLKQREDETDSAWQERMLQTRMHFLGVLEKSDNDRARARANNALVNISELTGEETTRQRTTVPPRQRGRAAKPAQGQGIERPAADTSAYPERVRTVPGVPDELKSKIGDSTRRQKELQERLAAAQAAAEPRKPEGTFLTKAHQRQFEVDERERVRRLNDPRSSNSIPRLEKSLNAVTEELKGLQEQAKEAVRIETVRGGPAVGPLKSDVTDRPLSDAEVIAKKAREEGRTVNAARKPREELALVDQQQRTLQALRQERTALEARLKFPQRSSRFRALQGEIGEIEGQTADLQGRFGGAGFHAQRTQRSFFGPGVFPSRTLSQRQEEVSRTADTTLRDAFLNIDRLRGGKSAKELGLEGVSGSARDKRRMRELLGPQVAGALEKVATGDLEGALGLSARQAGAEEGTGLRGALETLLNKGRGGLVPGVTKRTVGRILTGKDLNPPTSDEGVVDQERLDQQAAFAFEVQTLQDLIGSITTKQKELTSTAKRPRRRRRKAIERAEDPLRDEFYGAQAEVDRLEGQIETVRSAPTDVVDKEMVAFLEKVSPGRKSSNIKQLRLAAARQAKTPREPLGKLLGIKEANRPLPIRDLGSEPPGVAPAGLQSILGGFIAAQDISQPLTAKGGSLGNIAGLIAIPAPEVATPRQKKREDKREKRSANLIERLSQTPEQIALSSSGPPNKEALGALSAELQEARARLERLAKARSESLGAGQALKVEVEDVEPDAARKSTKAAENVSAFSNIGPIPGFGGGGGGEGGNVIGFPFGGGGGGPVPVEVVNFDALGAVLGGEGGTIAAQGVSPANISSADFERMFQPFVDNLAGVAEKLGGSGTGKAKTRTTGTRTRRGRLEPTTPRAFAAQRVAAGGITPEQAEGILEQPVGQITPLEQQRVAIEEQLAQARQGLPIRGFAVSVAQQLAGESRGAAFARFQRAGQLLGEAGGVEREATKQQQILKIQQTELGNLNKKADEGKKLTKDEKALRESLPDIIKKGTAELENTKRTQEDLVARASELAKLTGGEKLANLGKSLVGSIGGTVAFGTALGAVGAATAGIAAIVGTTTERLGGYRQATVQITNALSDQVRSQQGAVEQTVAQAAAQANLSKQTYDSIAATLEQRAAVEAGNKALAEQIKLTSASGNIQGETRKVGEQRFDKGLFETTGGFVIPGLNIQTPIGGTPSTQELIGDEIEAAINRNFAQHQSGRFLPRGQGTTFAPFSFGGGGGSSFGEGGPLVGVIEDLNERFKGTALQFVEGTSDMAASASDAAAALESAGFDDIAAELRKTTVGGAPVIGLDRRALELSPEQIATAIAQANERAQRPQAEVLLQALNERVIPAFLEQTNRELQNQLKIFIPAQRGLREATEPLPPFGRGLVPFAPGGGAATASPTFEGVTQTRFEGVPPEAIASFNQYRQEAQSAIDAVKAKAAEGRQALTRDLGVPESVLSGLEGITGRIGELRQEQADLASGLEYSQYNRQLTIARRTLGDITGLLGRAGGTQIGYLQREQLLLGRRSQALSLQSQQLGLQTGELQQQSAEIGQQSNQLQLQLSQRQINFQRAVAGFTAPGITPEERAARIEEAEIEADFAQRQLDFQKQQFQLQQRQIVINREQLELQRQGYELARAQFSNQVSLEDALNIRAFQDQVDSIADIEKAFQTRIAIQARQGLIDALSAEREQFLEEIQAHIGAGTKIIQGMSQFASDVLAQTGDFTQGIAAKVKTMFDQIRRENGWFFGPTTGGGGTGTPRNLPEGPDRFNAPGMLSMVKQPTRMMMGDAGGELVAVLRNPRPVVGGMTGGGGTFYAPIQISVTSTGNRSDDDDEKLAMRIGRLVEEQMGRRMTAYGLTPMR